MGTRNLSIFKCKGRLLGQYGQWDGYPSGQGVTAFEFIKNKIDVKKMIKQVGICKELTEEEIEGRWNECGANGTGWVSRDISVEYARRWPHLSRDTGAGIFQIVQAAESPEIHNQIEFAADSLFCEFAWMLDLDDMALTVFRGFNKRALGKEQFFKFLEKQKNDSRYFPVRHWKTVPFVKLKKMTKQKFLCLFEDNRK